MARLSGDNALGGIAVAHWHRITLELALALGCACHPGNGSALHRPVPLAGRLVEMSSNTSLQSGRAASVVPIQAPWWPAANFRR